MTSATLSAGYRSVTVAALILQGSVASQAAAQALTEVRPLLAVSRGFDSNVFSSASRPQSSLVLRVNPGVEAERRGPRVRTSASYTVNLEHLTGISTNRGAVSGHAATAGLSYQLSRRLSTTTDATFTRTRTPGDLSTVPGLTLGRLTADRLDVHPKIVTQLDGLMSGTLEYTFTRDHASGIGEMLSHRTAVSIDRQISRRDMVGFRYDIETTTFDVSNDRLTHRLRAGWNRPLTRLAHISVDAGAAASGHVTTPDLQASIGHRLRAADVEMTYARTQATVLGIGGMMDIESLAASGTFHPRRGFTLRMTPAVSRLRQDGGRLDAWGLGFDITRRVRLGDVRVSYQASAQRGALASATSGGTIVRHIAQVGFAFSAPASSCDMCDMEREQ